MKLNKIISSVLVFVMLFACTCFAIPVSATEATPEYEINILGSEDAMSEFNDVVNVLNGYSSYNYSTAEEMLNYELDPDGDPSTNDGYLDSIKYGDYEVYVNRYTGLMYYVNRITGQILTSNPIDPASLNMTKLPDALTSQIELEYFKTTDTSTGAPYYSSAWIQLGSFLSISKYGDNGIAVEYTLGPAVNNYIAPSVILYDVADEYIITPFFEKLASKLQEYCGDFDKALADDEYLPIKSYNVTDHAIYTDEDVYNFSTISSLLASYSTYVELKLAKSNPEGYKEISDLIDGFSAGLFGSYDVVTSENAERYFERHYESITALQNGKTVLNFKNLFEQKSGFFYRKVEKAIKLANPDYTFELSEAHEAECGYKAASNDEACFKVSICYSIDTDGSLIVDVPSNLMSYDESKFAIKSITPIKNFGAGKRSNDGYIFYPDGSGAIIEFDDFGGDSGSTTSIYSDSLVYGYDYCYYKTFTKEQKKWRHREQINMPVYGIIAEAGATSIGHSAGESKVDNGYFAIIEDGASLCELHYFVGESGHKYASVYSKYSPNPSDTYDLSQSISVSGLGSYTVVAPAAYGGSLKTRYTMLADSDVADSIALANGNFSGYKANYVGMANCYRDYLEKIDVINPIAEVYDDLPLYIEALGSISITKKVLSFPVTTSVPLTTFDDVAMMYEQLSDAHAQILKKAAEYKKTAEELEREDAAKHSEEITRNLALAEKYDALAEKIKDVKIRNINFRLTGFTNGGMHFTYPAKVKWESSVGGKKGLSQLLDIVSGKNKDKDANFGIYPDFDFMYINNTAAFDSISVKKIAACMVDNRYASKQMYNSVNQSYESMFALVVSTSSLDLLYSKFLKQYEKYGIDNISVSTLGSDLSSNFNSKDPVSREDGVKNVGALLSKMSSSYSVMADKGNIYTVKYLDHILNASIDSSHLKYASYTIPFFGMVMHGYVNYAGAPINYSGSPDYEILRSIENGASLYYILCTQNTNHLKNDSLLSKYYGIDYYNLFDSIVEQYAVVDGAIGDLQQHKIIDHSIIFAERVIVEKEMNANYGNLIDEFITKLDETVSSKIDAKIKEMKDNEQIGVGLKFTVSPEARTAIIAELANRINISVDELEERFAEKLDVIEATIAKYENDYKSGGEEVVISADDIEYESAYNYVTDSVATDENYQKTDFTCDNGNVVMVTYEGEVNGKKDTVVFLLNYNIFSVKIKLDETVHENYAEYCDADGYITLDSYGFIKIR